MTDRAINRTEEKEAESDHDKSDNGQQGHPGADQQQRSGLLEKLFTILSIALLLFLVGYLGVESIKENSPAAFDVQTSVAQRRGDFVAVAVIIKNTGDDTAKAVQVRGEAPIAGDKPAEAEATMDWLPGKSQRHVTLLFPGDADLSNLDVKVVGYEDP